ncbi:hypothetical protein PAQ31011_03326 [Pandoraea aquatica]|uniref:Delta-60 repeat domain-containing protein n=1 Tax=Pandoraea aquatica TaxID=2508290 RepID=A0A5E4WL12_9BURK|nr:hypothetical protein [Pandoraea aquatica]VVE24300.1 hypothetical protein PAQ31011_03326 [Pandoraea aquatica]
MSQALRSGDFDLTFGQGGHVETTLVTPGMMLLPDQKILIFSTLQDGVGMKVTRLLANGRPDPAFGENGVDVRLPHPFIGRMASFVPMRQSDNKIVVASTLTISSDISWGLVLRLHPDGRLDDTFGNAGVTVVDVPKGLGDSIRGAMMLPDDKIALVMECVIAPNNVIEVLVRLAADGTFDYTFGEGGFAYTIADGANFPRSSLLPDGKIVLAGSASYPDPVKLQAVVAQFLPDGQPDPSFGSEGYAYLDYQEAFPDFSFWQAAAFAVQPDGRIMLVGTCSDLPAGQFGDSLTWYTRLLPDGTSDASFNGGELVFSRAEGVEWFLGSMVVAGDGKVVAAGYTTGKSKAVLERLEPNGAADPTFGDGGVVIAELPSPDGIWVPSTLLAQADGKLLMLAHTFIYPTPMRLSRVLT